VVNIEKARRMLRWSPQVTLSDGLARTAAWMRTSSFDGGSPSSGPAIPGYAPATSASD
jgi:hypothetical protein